jgi:Phosphoribosylaminoimidazolesuccinocarboxamide (SAICAR) synthase
MTANGDDTDAYDYDAYHDAAGENFLIPLEVVFRNTVPVGSSLRKRGDPADYGLDSQEWPDEKVALPEPVVEFSTKYEEQDRYLSRDEADRIAGVAAIDDLESVARSVNELLNEQAAAAGFTHEDGKIECLYHDGEIRVADVVGTFDENRFSVDGHQLSKEVIRQYYKREQPEWVDAVSEAKANVVVTDGADWRPLCEIDPITLPNEVVTAVADMYSAGANAYTGTGWFDAPSLADAVDAITEL